MKVFLVSHTHWDREWYRPFQAFRARLVDAIDRVLDLVARDPGFRFVLDGQTVALEDYLEVRPARRAELEAACRAGRIAIGPWYVQPDSLLPSGEAHVRNLLEGRRAGEGVGPVSRVAYTPDSFGHPAQLPQIFRGFGLEPFVYWRGNGDEVDALPSEYLWEAPDGSAVLAHVLREGYFAAAGLPDDDEQAAAFLADLARRLAERTTSGAVLLMNGFDHALPEERVARAAAALARREGFEVQRALLDDFARALPRDAPRFRGELTGARLANLLPGVWSTRIPQKLRNRRAEAELEAWAEPWSALARALGAPDEEPSLRAAWRELLKNQAHDSLCGCSQDRVHEQMEARYDAASGLASETTARCLERLAGLGPERVVPWSEEVEVAVFNPSPHPRTDLVRFALEPMPWIAFRGEGGRHMSIHPLLRADVSAAGFTVDGRPARVVDEPEGGRIRLLPDRAPRSVELVAADVPAFGWRRFRLAPSAAAPDEEDDGREVAAGDVSVRAADDGTLEATIGGRTWRGLAALEDVGDRGDTYDFDPVPGGEPRLESVVLRRCRHASGIQELHVRRVLSVPAGLADDRRARSDERVALTLDVTARVAPGVARVELDVRLDNTARDHRLRLLFPTGAPAAEAHAATTFDVVPRATGKRDASRWVHPAPATFPQQGFVAANGLMVVAPGLPEAEVAPDGTIALTLVRAVGWLARMDLRTRPQIAGPMIPTPGAQCSTTVAARLALAPGPDPRAARDAEVGLRAVCAGDEPLVPPGESLVVLEPASLVLSALKPASGRPGIVLRVLNPTDTAETARLTLRFPFARAVPVGLDETPCEGVLDASADGMAFAVPPHALRSVLLVD